MRNVILLQFRGFLECHAKENWTSCTRRRKTNEVDAATTFDRMSKKRKVFSSLLLEIYFQRKSFLEGTSGAGGDVCPAIKHARPPSSWAFRSCICIEKMPVPESASIPVLISNSRARFVFYSRERKEPYVFTVSVVNLYVILLLERLIMT